MASQPRATSLQADLEKRCSALYASTQHTINLVDLCLQTGQHEM